MYFVVYSQKFHRHSNGKNRFWKVVNYSACLTLWQCGGCWGLMNGLSGRRASVTLLIKHYQSCSKPKSHFLSLCDTMWHYMTWASCDTMWHEHHKVQVSDTLYFISYVTLKSNSMHDKTNTVLQCQPGYKNIGRNTLSTSWHKTSLCRIHWCDPGLGDTLLLVSL